MKMPDKVEKVNFGQIGPPPTQTQSFDLILGSVVKPQQQNQSNRGLEISVQLNVYIIVL